MSRSFLWFVTMFALCLDIFGIFMVTRYGELQGSILIFGLSLLMLLGIYKQVMKT